VVRVPTYDEQRINPAGIPDARITAVPSPDAFGASAAQAIGNGVANIALTEQKHADEIAAMRLSNDFTALKQELRQTIRSRQGSDAFTLPEEVQSEWTKRASDIRASARAGHQQQFADEMDQRGWQDLNDEMHVHIDREKTQYDADQHKAYQVNQANDAVAAATSPMIAGETVDGYIARISAGVEKAANNSATANDMYGQRNGQQPDLTKAQTAAYKSGIYSQAILAQLSQGNSVAAKGLYAKYADELVGGDKISAEKSLEVASDDSAAQAIADQIQQKAIGDQSYTLYDAVQEARKLAGSDTKQGDEAERRVINDWNIRIRSQTDRQNELFDQAQAQLEQTGKLSGVDKEIRAALNERQLNVLREAERKIASGELVPNNSDKYVELSALASTEEKQPEFMQMYLPTIKSQVSPPDYGKLVEAQNNLRKQTSKDPKQTSEESIERVAKDTLASIDIGGDRGKYGKKDDGTVGFIPNTLGMQFRKRFRQEIEAAQVAKGKPLQSEELSKIASSLIANVTFQKTTHPYWFNSFYVSADNPTGAKYESVSAPAFTIQGAATHVGQIPESEMPQIKEALNAKGAAITDDNLVETYNAFLGSQNE
jgi:hypothetical protein